MLDPLAQAEGPPVQVKPVLAGRRGDEQLDEPGQDRERACPARCDVVRNVAPAEHD